MKSQEDHRLIQDYLDDVVSEADIAELDRELATRTEMADEFVRALQFESLLSTCCRDLRSAGKVEALLHEVSPITRERNSTSHQPQKATRHRRLEPSRSVARRSVRHTPWIVVAVVLVAVGLGLVSLMLLDGGATVVASEPHRVVSGRVLVNGVESQQVPDGSTIEVLGNQDAIIKLVDGSAAELARASQAIIHGPHGSARQVIELTRGRGDFEVEEAEGTFRVDTPVGSVTALGTEFSVELQDESIGERIVSKQMTLGLLVAVLVGAVEVNYEGQQYALALGEDRVFEKGKGAGAGKPDLAGLVSHVADDGKSFTLKQPADKKAGKEAVVSEIEIDDATTLSFVNVSKGEQKPRVGHSAEIWFVNDSQTLAAAVRLAAKKGAGPKPNLIGKVTAVSDDGQQLTLDIAKKKGQSAQQHTIKLSDRTKMSYTYVPIDGKHPTAGYNVAVWLEGADSGIATLMKFTGSKEYRPDYTGRVLAVSDDGDSITLAYREMKTGPEGEVTVRIADNTKLVYTGVDREQQRPTVGFAATVWLDKGKQDVASGIEFVHVKKKIVSKPSKPKPLKPDPTASKVPKLAGRIIAVGDNERQFTISQHAKTGAPTERVIKLNGKTELSFKGIQQEDERPSLGYYVEVSFVAGSEEVAAAISFSTAGLLPFPKGVSLTASQRKELALLRLEYSLKLQDFQRRRSEVLTEEQREASALAKKELYAAGLKDPQLLKEAIDAAVRLTQEQKTQIDELLKQEKELHQAFQTEVRKRIAHE